MKPGGWLWEPSPSEVGQRDRRAEPEEVKPDVLENVIADEKHDHPEMPTLHACSVEMGSRVGGHRRWLGYPMCQQNCKRSRGSIDIKMICTWDEG